MQTWSGKEDCLDLLTTQQEKRHRIARDKNEEMRSRYYRYTALSLFLASANAFKASSLGRTRFGVKATPKCETVLFLEKSLIVLSPPGGVGEVAVVKAATLGSSVKWFVVTGTGDAAVSFAQETLQDVREAGGSVELAGASASSLLDGSALPAFRQWCGGAEGMICTMDGVSGTVTKDDDPVTTWQNAIKVAALEAASTIRGMALAVLPADEDDDANAQTDQGNPFLNLLGKKGVAVPSSLSVALGKPTTLRHGELFGIPESSPNFSAIVGGPRRDAILTEEYTMRSVRMDSSLSVSGNTMMGSTTRSSRHAVGEAAALMVLGKVPIAASGDVCVSSLPGKVPVSLEEWQEEFQRVESMIQAGQGAQLFTTAFTSVPDVERLADWIATKWAPAVLRTYDIAAIRIGARPVSASRTGAGQVQIIWQELVDFSTVTAGKMIIQVSETGITATRAGGDASKGFGAISRKPLNGEDVLVRQLAEAASQAVEKGLANKAIISKPVQQELKKIDPVAPVSSVVSVVTVGPVVTAESGPRQAGARRSSERTRGARTRRADGTGSAPTGSTDMEKVAEDEEDDGGFQ